MHTMLFVSMVFHVLIFMHISGLYHSETISYIEVSMQNISKSFSRNIPRPRLRSETPKLLDIKKPDIRKNHMPRIKIDPIDNNFTDNLMGNISVPDIFESSSLKMSDMNFRDGNEHFVSSNDYFDMLRLKIERRKKYPEKAKKGQVEGRVKVQFTVTKDGQVSSLKIVKHARDKSLNKAALDAVRNAAPFPRPPPKLFKGMLRMEITIVFDSRS